MLQRIPRAQEPLKKGTSRNFGFSNLGGLTKDAEFESSIQTGSDRRR
jgi:hypothetical protein